MTAFLSTYCHWIAWPVVAVIAAVVVPVLMRFR